MTTKNLGTYVSPPLPRPAPPISCVTPTPNGFFSFPPSHLFIHADVNPWDVTEGVSHNVPSYGVEVGVEGWVTAKKQITLSLLSAPTSSSAAWCKGQGATEIECRFECRFENQSTLN